MRLLGSTSLYTGSRWIQVKFAKKGTHYSTGVGTSELVRKKSSLHIQVHPLLVELSDGFSFEVAPETELPVEYKGKKAYCPAGELKLGLLLSPPRAPIWHDGGPAWATTIPPEVLGAALIEPQDEQDTLAITYPRDRDIVYDTGAMPEYGITDGDFGDYALTYIFRTKAYGGSYLYNVLDDAGMTKRNPSGPRIPQGYMEASSDYRVRLLRAMDETPLKIADPRRTQMKLRRGLPRELTAQVRQLKLSLGEPLHPSGRMVTSITECGRLEDMYDLDLPVGTCVIDSFVIAGRYGKTRG